MPFKEQNESETFMYEETADQEKEPIADEIPLDADVEIDDGYDADLSSIREDKGKSNRHSLEVRRAIEDHLEKMRLQEEFDYLYDDDFVSDK